jgi:hypothetical protein
MQLVTSLDVTFGSFGYGLPMLLLPVTGKSPCCIFVSDRKTVSLQILPLFSSTAHPSHGVLRSTHRVERLRSALRTYIRE